MKKKLFLSGSEPEIIRKLKLMSYETVICVPDNALDAPVRSHADCLIFTPDENTYFAEKGNYNNIVNYLTRGEGTDRAEDRKIIKVEGVKSPYPDDVKLNAKAFGRKILCNTACISDLIRSFALNNGFELMHCNQGYAACSTLKLSDSAAITDDSSIYDTLTANGIDCIKVSKGSVKLNGYSYGFIGGCCGLIDNNLLAFAGNINTHPDAELIKTFLIKHGIDYVNLYDGQLIDIGGIITI